MCSLSSSALFAHSETLRIPYLSGYKTGSFSLSRMTTNNWSSPMEFCYNTSFIHRVRTDLEKSLKMTLVLENSLNSKKVQFVLELSLNFEKKSLIITKSP